MLVLNTTSPRASPAAPAATPRYQVPSSSANTAFIDSPVFLVLTNGLQRSGHPRAASGIDVHRRRPRAVTLHLEPHLVRTRPDTGKQQRRCTDRRVIQDDPCAFRPRINAQLAWRV